MAAPPVRTVLEIITASYRKFGVAEVGEALTAELAADGLMAFQDLLAELAGEGLIVPSYQSEYIEMAVGQNSYTIGEDGAPDKDAIRPNQIPNAFMRVDNYDWPVKIIGEAAFIRIFDKSGSNSRPKYLWYNPTVPNGTVSVYPPPDTTDNLYIYYPKQFIDAAELANDIMIDVGMPRNYSNPLIWMLAEELAPESGVDPGIWMGIMTKAEKVKNSIRSLVAANASQAVAIEFARGGSYYDDLNPYR